MTDRLTIWLLSHILSMVFNFLLIRSDCRVAKGIKFSRAIPEKVHVVSPVDWHCDSMGITLEVGIYPWHDLEKVIEIFVLFWGQGLTMQIRLISNSLCSSCLDLLGARIQVYITRLVLGLQFCISITRQYEKATRWSFP